MNTETLFWIVSIDAAGRGRGDTARSTLPGFEAVS